jgi:O-succinylbenzoate synthase
LSTPWLLEVTVMGIRLPALPLRLACEHGAVPVLDPLPPVHVEAVELVTVSLPLLRPLRTATGTRSQRHVLLVHVVAGEAEGWAECVAEPEPSYAPEFTASAELVLRDHLLPRAWAGPTGDALALGPHLDPVRGHPMSRAALELAILDAQLRAADRSLADWLGATATAVPCGAALGLHDHVRDLLAEAEGAVAAGAARLRVKVAPGRAAEPVLTLREHLGPDALLQADANGSFRLNDPDHLAELERLDDAELACLEQPLPPDDLVGHARLAQRLATPICLDESITSLGALEAAVALGACGVLCLKPGRVGGWLTAAAIVDRCAELGLPVWVGGMLETGVGRAANVALAALPHMALPPDLDPRPRYAVDLAPVAGPGPDGLVPVPTTPGANPAPDPSVLTDLAARRTTTRGNSSRS